MGPDPERLKSASEELGAKSQVVDIVDPDAVVAALAASEAQGGPVSICVNSAGVAGPERAARRL